MNRFLPLNNWIRGCTAAALILSGVKADALNPSEWRFEQAIEAQEPGLGRIELPPATLDVAGPRLEDLRVLDQAGAEVPFLLYQPKPEPEDIRAPLAFRTMLEAKATVIVIEPETPIIGVTLETPGKAFVKAVTVEGSDDAKTWDPVASGIPIFRVAQGPDNLTISFPLVKFSFLRITIDDERTEPVPFRGARIHRPRGGEPDVAPVPITIRSRDESPGVTRLNLDLGLRNLHLAGIELETTDPLFTRKIKIAISEVVANEGILERQICEGTIHRINLEGTSVEQLKVSLERQIPGRELLLFIHNGDSPPLQVTAIRGMRRPVFMLFWVREAGGLKLLSGNRQCAAASYDVAAMENSIRRRPATTLQLGELVENRSFRVSEPLQGLGEPGAELDLKGWKYWKSVHISKPGAQQLEADLEVLAYADPSLRDLRVMRGTRQIPFLLERTSISRSLKLSLVAAPDPKRPRVSRWSMKLPHPRLPITRIACRTSSPLFERHLSLIEEYDDVNGHRATRPLGNAHWQNAPGRVAADLILALNVPPQTDTLILETDNGDNPAIELSELRAFYPASRLIFKAGANDPVQLHFGNPKASAPRYDLSLVAGPLLAMERNGVELGPQQGATAPDARVTKSEWQILFWITLALVVAGLLWVLARLLPKAEEPR